MNASGRCLMTLQVKASCVLEYLCWQQRHAWPSSGINNASTSQKQRKGSAQARWLKAQQDVVHSLSFTPEPTFAPRHTTTLFNIRHHHRPFKIHACGFSLVSISDFFFAHIIRGWTLLAVDHCCTTYTSLQLAYESIERGVSKIRQRTERKESKQECMRAHLLLSFLLVYSSSASSSVYHSTSVTLWLAWSLRQSP